ALGTAALCGVILGTVQPARAQVTTGNIVGNVKDPQGGALPGAVVVATHVPTGTVYQAVTGRDGRYQVLEVRVGGPYTVKVTFSGFKDGVESDVNVKLGEDRDVSFTLELKTVETDVTVSAPVIDTTQPGAVANISAEQAASIPTIARNMFDLVQVNPYFVGYNAAGNGQLSIAIAGRNNRYNNIEIDGAVNNDIFGLSNTGTPEGQAGSQPISLDAIQEFQLLVSPYDVRQGGFSGGGINIVTRSGSNVFGGDGFIYWQNQSLTGQYFNPTLLNTTTGVVGNLSGPSAPFTDTQGGGSIGGPIKKDKVFFFATSDSQREQTPSGIIADGSTPNFAPTLGAATELADLQAITTTLQNKYGYNPAGSSGLDAFGNFNRATNNDKEFARVDINLKPGERLTIRNNFINSNADSGTPTAGEFLFPDNYVHFHIKTDSTVGQLNSTFGGNMVNELRLASTEIRNYRGGEPFEQEPFPNLTIELAGSSVEAVVGRDNSSTANQLFQDDIELNDDLTMVHGNHTFSVGTHDEFFHFQNLFIQDTFGKYTFTSLANFEAGLAQGYAFDFSNTGNPLQQADFRVAQYGAYAGDVWRVKPRLTLTGGIRVDLPRFNSTPGANPLTVTDFGMATNVVPTPAQFSPRLGFAWDPKGNGRQVLRGGAGVFSGRTPYVWISNQFSNNGLEFTDVSISTNSSNKIPFVANSMDQPTSPTGATVATAKQTIDLINPNFQFPSQFRANIAYDSNLPWGLVGKGEVLFNKTLEDILYQNLNLTQTGTSVLDGRPLFTPTFPTIGPAVLLTNTTQGHGYSLSYDVQRQFKNALGFEVGYLYGQQYTVEESESSVALTSWEDVYATNPNNPAETRSDFSPGQHVTANVSYAVPVSHGMSALLSLVYLGQSGHPYSLSYSFDVNGDQQDFNDLLLLMNAQQASGIQFTGGPNPSYQTYLNFLNSLGSCVTDQIGSIYVRNSCRAPWTNTLDARLTFRLPFKRLKTDVTLDIFNLLNLLNSHWGNVDFVNFNQIDLVNPFTTNAGPSATNPQLTRVDLTALNPTTPGTFSPFSIDDARSRWQMQLGLRIAF
ncbi:MAG TPA: carboxypeptidase regulatory-like domain-containing protein, partial [Vicinamibacterales bacterium]